MGERVLMHETKSLQPESNRIEPISVIHCNSSQIAQEGIVPDRFRIFFVQTGSGTVSIDGVSHAWVSPAIFCVSEIQHIEIQMYTESESSPLLVLSFHPKFIQKRLNFENIRYKGMNVDSDVVDSRLILWPFIAEDQQPIITHISPESALRVTNLFNACAKELTEQPSGWWPCRTRSFLTELLFFINQLQEKKDSYSKSNNGILSVSEDFKPVLEYIMRLYNTPLSLKEISKNFATNRTSLNERFKKETGVTAIQYIIDVRLRIASSFLASTDLSVSEIALRTGCGDVSHFERQFKKKYGLTAAAYRATIRK